MSFNFENQQYYSNIQKKRSKLVCSNYKLISLLSNIDQILERHRFLENKEELLCLPNLVFDRNIQLFVLLFI